MRTTKEFKSPARRAAELPQSKGEAVTLKPPRTPTAAEMRAVAKTARKLPIFEHIQEMLGDVEAVNISEARTQMPKMVRDSAGGATFIIRSARANGAPVAVLIGLETFNRVVAEPKSTRTVGEILESLPFSGMDLKSPTAMELPGADLPTAFLPK